MKNKKKILIFVVLSFCLILNHNIFGQSLKSKNLPDDAYPFSELMHNWEKFMLEKNGRRNLADWLSTGSSLM